MKIADFFVERYRVVVNVAGTVLVAWLLSALVSQVIAMVLPEPRVVATPSQDPDEMPMDNLLTATQSRNVGTYMPICERNIFDSQKRTSCVEEVATLEDVEVESIDLNADPVLSDLNAALLGTMVMNNASRSFATVAPNKGKDSKTFRVGDEIMNEAKIYEIVRNKVFFVRNGRREFLQVDKLPIFSVAPARHSHRSSKGIKRDGNKITLSRAKVESTLADLNKVIQQSRMVPNYENGKVTGFKIFAIRKDSIFDQLGLKNGDVIQRINGTTVDSIEKALPMLEIVKTESNVSIDIVRRGNKKTMGITIQ